ncbi:hypothetical protein T06_2741 [Trichinella sp. T6]|nr:hypothetical protein T06_2741 [Trichinella sp. T6]
MNESLCEEHSGKAKLDTFKRLKKPQLAALTTSFEISKATASLAAHRKEDMCKIASNTVNNNSGQLISVTTEVHRGRKGKKYIQTDCGVKKIIKFNLQQLPAYYGPTVERVVAVRQQSRKLSRLPITLINDMSSSIHTYTEPRLWCKSINNLDTVRNVH